MRRVTAASLAIAAVGGLVLVVAHMRGGDRSEAPEATPSPRLLVGFLDDANFRWRPYRARMLDGAQRTGAHESIPDEPNGIPPGLQATYAARALELAARVPRVRMFVWFTFRDDRTNAWQSGLIDGRGQPRPAYEQFTSAVAALAGP